MTNQTRRQFIEQMLKTTAVGTTTFLQGGSILTTLFSCAEQPEGDPLKDGQFVKTIPFVGESDLPVNQLLGDGLNARKYFDLAKVKQTAQTTPNEHFFIRTGHPELPKSLDAWQVTLKPTPGQVQTVSLGELVPEAAAMGLHLAECAGNDRAGHFGLMSVAKWGGFPLSEILKKWNFPKEGFIKISGFDKHSSRPIGSTEGASWIFAYSQLTKAGAFLATQMNGVPLDRDHGLPVRLVVPGWYACTYFKWVSEISVVPETEPATSQMHEFASRTHQVGDPVLAKEFAPANIDFAATPVRIEQWRVGSKRVYLVVGIAWGGEKTPASVLIRFNNKSTYVPVRTFQRNATDPWSVWSHVWTDPQPGKYRIQLRVNDRAVPTRRLDVGYYARRVEITA